MIKEYRRERFRFDNLYIMRNHSAYGASEHVPRNPAPHGTEGFIQSDYGKDAFGVQKPRKAQSAVKA